jgi:nucleotide-binding universal stress UspA family protein
MSSLGDAARTAGVRFKVSVQHGDPAGVIELHAKSRRADLIVLGASTRSGLDRFRFGSVAETVARKATQPVLVVPAGTGTAGDPATPFKNILVAVDLGEGSRAAVERALSMANGESRVTVLHVIPGTNLAQAAWRRIATIVPAGARMGRQIHARVVTGEPSAEISRVAAEVDAGVILVGSTGRGAISRLIMGSTSARVIREAGRPVLAIPQAAAIAALDDEADRWAVAA